VRGVSFDIQRSETHGIVGESGCGKSTIAFGIVNFLGRNGKIVKGNILFQGQDLVARSQRELRKIRGDRIAMVYQDPMQALNPSMRIGDQMSGVVHRGMKKQAAEDKCIQMLDRVYMPDRPTSCAASHTRFRAGSSSASSSRWRCSTTRRCSSWTSRRRRWM
jgi:peptide/nickel transport system ATP-binding protein